MAYEDHWVPGFNFNVEEWDAEGQTYEMLAICRTGAFAPEPLELARRATFARRFGAKII
jgi:hypothetical protein